MSRTIDVTPGAQDRNEPSARTGRTLTLPEELLLLELNDERTPLRPAGSLYNHGFASGLVGAQHVELALAGRIRRAEPTLTTRIMRDRKLVVVDDAPTGDAALDAMLAMIGASRQQRRKLASESAPGQPAENSFATHAHPVQLYLERLEARGLVRAERARVLGFMRAKNYPAIDTSAKEEVRTRIREMLSGQRADAHTAALATLMLASGLEHRVFERRERKLARRQIHAIALGRLMDSAQADVLIVACAGIRAELADNSSSGGG